MAHTSCRRADSAKPIAGVMYAPALPGSTSSHITSLPAAGRNGLRNSWPTIRSPSTCSSKLELSAVLTGGFALPLGQRERGMSSQPWGGWETRDAEEAEMGEAWQAWAWLCEGNLAALMGSHAFSPSVGWASDDIASQSLRRGSAASSSRGRSPARRKRPWGVSS